MNKSQIEFLSKFFKIKNYHFKTNSTITPYLSLKIGNKAQFIIEVTNSIQFIEILQHLIVNNVNYIILGGGTNTVFSSSLFHGVALINKTGKILINDQNQLVVDSGVKNQDLMTFCQKNGLGGLEFLSGLPGTIGGAAAVNAGAFNNSMQNITISSEIYTKDNALKTIKSHQFEFSYRHSRFKFGRDFILNLTLKTYPADNLSIKAKIKENLNYRINNHPSYKENTAGCFFKNPTINNKKFSAGKLIQELNLKGKTFNSLQISPKHANFLLNKGNASFKDLQNCVTFINSKIIEKYGISLEKEVIYISEKGEKI